MTRPAQGRRQRRNARRRGAAMPLILIMLAAALALLCLFRNAGPAEPQPPAGSGTAARTADAPRPSAPENSALYWGNPSGARADPDSSANYLMEKAQYALSYNAGTLIPNWVMWHLCAADLGGAERGDSFRPDRTLPAEWRAVSKSDYQYAKYGFDRGHLCPSADRTADAAANDETFLMTNMIPQAPNCNRIVWKALEDYGRKLAKDGKELYIAAGPHGTGGTGAAGFFESIELPPRKDAGYAGGRSGGAIAVPAACWKVILVLEEGDDDFSRVTAETPAIAVFIPNRQGVARIGAWTHFLTTVDDIEEKTGLDFFSFLPDDIESAVEARKYAVPGA